MSKTLPNLYNYSKYYHLAFNRDIKAEADFFLNCFKKYTMLDIKKVIEPACGSGILLKTFAEKGLEILGFDINPNMVEYTKELLQNEDLLHNADVVLGDMRKISFKEKYDAAVILISSLSYCINSKDILNHFKNMYNMLNDGGIYIVEIFCACNDIENEHGPDETWSVETDGINIDVSWIVEKYDIKNRTRHINCTMNVSENGESFSFAEKHKLRLWYFNEFLNFIQSAGFILVSIYNQKFEKISNTEPVSGELGALYFILKKE